MNELIELLKNPVVWKLLFVYWGFNALVGHLPSPKDVAAVMKNPSPVGLLIYGTIFGFLHGLAGNIDRAAVSFKVPGAQVEPPEAPKS